jgi:hypothetical protein
MLVSTHFISFYPNIAGVLTSKNPEAVDRNIEAIMTVF